MDVKIPAACCGYLKQSGENLMKHKIIYMAMGIIIGTLFANFKASDYFHGMLALKEGGDTQPLYIKPGEGKRTLALSVRNQQDSPDVRITVDGGSVMSPYPPPIRLPFRKWVSVRDNIFSGLRNGMKFPLYVVLDGKREAYELSFVRVADGSIINKVPILRGDGHATHH